MGKATVTKPPTNPPAYNKPGVVTPNRTSSNVQNSSTVPLKRDKDSLEEVSSKQPNTNSKDSQSWTHEEILKLLNWLSNGENLSAFRANAMAQYKVMEQKLNIFKSASQIQRQLEFLGEKYKLIKIRSSMNPSTNPEKQREVNCKSFQYFSLMDEIFGSDTKPSMPAHQAPIRSQTLATGAGSTSTNPPKKNDNPQTYFYLPKPIRPSQIKSNFSNPGGGAPSHNQRHTSMSSTISGSSTSFNRPPPPRGETVPSSYKPLVPSTLKQVEAPHSSERYERNYPMHGGHHQNGSYSPPHDDADLSPLQSQVLRKKLQLLETQERYLEEQRQDMVMERNHNQAQLDLISKSLLSLNQQLEKQSQILGELVSQVKEQKKGDRK